MHYALRALIHAAADNNDIDPDRISFTKALHAARRSVRTGLTGLTATVNLATAIGRATTELLHGGGSCPWQQRYWIGSAT